MPSIVTLLKGADGLLPHLESNLSEDFRRFQIRGWDFDSSQGPAGYRYRAAESDFDSVSQPYSIRDGIVSSQEITIGKVITIPDGDIEAAEDAAAVFRENLDAEIMRWSVNCQNALEDDINRITGTMYPEHDANVPSRTARKSWAFVVIRTFNIVYRLN